MTALAILSSSPGIGNEPTPFDTAMIVEARFAGGTITADVDHVEWLGRDVICVDIPGLTLHLYPHEARDLAAALQALATFVDEAVAA